MLGRIAAENPCLLADIDRYFYGETNPCQTRRDIVNQYCEYLERVYPRRCCDQQEFSTSTIVGQEEILFEFDCCHACADIYYPDAAKSLEDEDGHGMTSTVSIAPEGYRQGAPKVKAYVLSRAARPIQPVFYGQPKGKTFSRECERLIRDAHFHNCGPGAIIRRALRAMPDELLDQPLTPTPD